MTDVTRFFACYLLTSLKEGCKDHTYIGFTINPKRRIRQHNGEITNGAARTSKKRPWEMLLVVYGFPTKKEALAFEWNWQKPFLSKLLRAIANDLVAQKTMGNRWKLKFKVRMMFEMLQISPWNRFPLTVHWLGRNPVNTPSLYPPFPAPPDHIKQIYAPMTELDMLLQQDSNGDPEGFESGEEDHEEEDDLAIVETERNGPQQSNSSTLNRSSSALARYAALWGEEMPDLDFLGRNSLTHRADNQTSSTNTTSRATTNTSASENSTSRGPRRSLSANSLVRSHPTTALPIETLNYHNKSIEEDDDSFLQVPAFAPAAPVAVSKRTASSRGSAAVTSSSSSIGRPQSAVPVVSTSGVQMEVDEPAANGEVTCFVCALQVLKLDHGICCSKDECATAFHIVCLATKALKDEEEANGPSATKTLIPASATCPSCNHKHRWMDLVRHKQRTMNHGSNPLRALVRAEGR